jgi:hypothetical protein
VRTAELRGTYRAVIILLFTIILTGCGGVPPQAPYAGGPQTATIPPASQPIAQIAASPVAVNFGQVQVGASNTQTIVVSNSGTADATINSASSNGAGFRLADTAFPLAVNAGRSLTLQLTFAPSSAGSATGALTLSVSSQPSLSVALAGSGVATVSSGTPAHEVALSWNASTSLVDRYLVYRSTQPGGPYARINTSPAAVTWYSDTNVSGGQTYYYVVTAIAATVESAYSNESVAAVPSP